MNFNENVDKDFVNLVLESSLWSKANIKVNKEVLNESDDEGDIGIIPEYENGVVNEYEEPTDVEEYVAPSEDDVSFTLGDLQVVLDNLDDESLMEHAMNMLDVFDVAYDALNEEDVEEDEEDEEYEELDERKKKGRAYKK